MLVASKPIDGTDSDSLELEPSFPSHAVPTPSPSWSASALFPIALPFDSILFSIDV